MRYLAGFVLLGGLLVAEARWQRELERRRQAALRLAQLRRGLALHMQITAAVIGLALVPVLRSAVQAFEDYARAMERLGQRLGEEVRR